MYLSVQLLSLFQSNFEGSAAVADMPVLHSIYCGVPRRFDGTSVMNLVDFLSNQAERFSFKYFVVIITFVDAD